MSESKEHKKRYNQRLAYIARFNKWLEAEPSMIRFIKWRRWKNSRPVWAEVDGERKENG